MAGERLRNLLKKIGDIAWSPPAERADDASRAWIIANAEAWLALELWRGVPSRAGYAVYRAAADRADAAQDALAAATRR